MELDAYIRCNKTMSDLPTYPRFIERRLMEALEDAPVTLIHGPRQCGKTTLARMVGEPQDYVYLNLDDPVTRSAAEDDPAGFVLELPPKSIIDEVQRVPALFTPLKMAVDRQRIPGRYLLTGSTQVLLVPQLADSLAGRMQIVRLHPLAQCELQGAIPGFLRTLFQSKFKIQRTEHLAQRLAQAIVTGGYPPVFRLPTGPRQVRWYHDFLDAQIQRDVRDLARIRSLDILPRILALASAQTACLFNLSDLAAPFQLSWPTIRDYVELLERIFLLERLQPWHSNRMKRLIKTPKLHMGDTGLACSLLGVDARTLWADRSLLGQLLETFVFQELRRQASWQDTSLTFYHYRDKDGAEVDIVIERDPQTLAGVEIKAGATVTPSDFRGLHRLQKAAGSRFVCGIVLYDGETCVPFGEKLYAVPLRLLWEMS